MPYLDKVVFNSKTQGVSESINIRDAEGRGLIQDNANKIAALEAREKLDRQDIDRIDGELDLLEGRVGECEDDIYELEQRMTEAETVNDNQNKRLDSLEGRMDTAEDDIDKLEERMDSAEAKNDEQDARLDAVEAKNTEQDGRLDAIDAKNTEQDSRLDAVEADVDTLQEDVTKLYDKDKEQDGRMDEMDERIAASTYEAGEGIYFGQGKVHTSINVEDEVLDQIAQNTEDIDVLKKTKTEIFRTVDGERVNYTEAEIGKHTMEITQDGELTAVDYVIDLYAKQPDLSDLDAETSGGHDVFECLREIFNHFALGSFNISNRYTKTYSPIYAGSVFLYIHINSEVGERPITESRKVPVVITNTGISSMTDNGSLIGYTTDADNNPVFVKLDYDLMRSTYSVSVKPLADKDSVDVLEAILDKVEQDVESIKEKDTEQDGRLDSVESKNTEQDGKISSLETRVDTAETDIDNLEGRMASAEAKNTEQDTSIGNINEVLAGLYKRFVETKPSQLIPEGADIDTYTEPGTYYAAPGTTVTNGPVLLNNSDSRNYGETIYDRETPTNGFILMVFNVNGSTCQVSFGRSFMRSVNSGSRGNVFGLSFRFIESNKTWNILTSDTIAKTLNPTAADVFKVKDRTGVSVKQNTFSFNSLKEYGRYEYDAKNMDYYFEFESISGAPKFKTMSGETITSGFVGKFSICNEIVANGNIKQTFFTEGLFTGNLEQPVLSAIEMVRYTFSGGSQWGDWMTTYERVR